MAFSSFQDYENEFNGQDAYQQERINAHKIRTIHKPSYVNPYEKTNRTT